MSGPDKLTARVRRAIGELPSSPPPTIDTVARKAYPKRVDPGWPLADYQRAARAELVRLFGSAR